MSKDLDKLLDKCIDRMNEGESLEECLASYPEQAKELEPLLRAVWDFRGAFSLIPRASAKSVTRRRLDAALVNSDRRLQERQRRTKPLFGWTRAWATVAIVLVLAVIGYGLYWFLTPEVAPVVAQANFRLLLSDQENAIGDFESLEVTITSIGMSRGGESGSWEVITLAPGIVRDLTDLPGLNAQEVWSGNLLEGQYNKVFIYIDNVSGMINGEPGEVKLPSGKLHISKPFAITADELVVNFVYDVTVIEAGESGKYILLPQANQSGANQSYHEVGEGELIIKVVEVDGEVAPGKTITILVTLDGSPVPDEALVEVNDDYFVGTTTNGEVTFIVPYDDELEIEAVWRELEGELEIDLEWESEEGELILQVVHADTLLVIDDDDVTSGQRVRVLVTLDGGSPAEDAQVTVEDVDVFTTGNNGVTTDYFIVPFDDELEIEAVWGELEGELEIDLEGESYEVGESELTLQVVDADTLQVIDDDDVTPEQSVRVLVTLEGNAVARAQVEVNDEDIGETDVDGLTDSFTVPYDDELEIEAKKGKLKGELEIELQKGEVEIKEVEEEEVEELRFEGIIETIDGNTWTMTIDSETRTVDVSEAEIEGEPAVGLEAELRGAVVDDTIVASEVEIRED